MNNTIYNNYKIKFVCLFFFFWEILLFYFEDFILFYFEDGIEYKVDDIDLVCLTM
jgi:hypothetical protein